MDTAYPAGKTTITSWTAMGKAGNKATAVQNIAVSRSTRWTITAIGQCGLQARTT